MIIKMIGMTPDVTTLMIMIKSMPRQIVSPAFTAAQCGKMALKQNQNTMF